jgi:protein SCO1/2
VLADYVSSFHARLVALTGPAPVIRRVALAYKVFFSKSAVVGLDGYAIDHTSFIYLVGKDGRYVDFLPSGLAPERIIEALRLHLDRQNGP